MIEIYFMYLSSIFLFWWILHVWLQKNVHSIVVGWSSLKRSVRSQSFQSQVQAFYILTDLPTSSINLCDPWQNRWFLYFPFISEKIPLLVFCSSVIILAGMLGILPPCWWMCSCVIRKCLRDQAVSLSWNPVFWHWCGHYALLPLVSTAYLLPPGRF